MGWNEDFELQKLAVLRVVQLDGAILDHEILHLLESQVKKIFQKFQVQTFKWIPEVNLLLRFILWKYTINKNSATIGQSLFDVKYALWKDNKYIPISSKQKLVLGLCYICGQWIQERTDDILVSFQSYEYLTGKIRLFLRWLDNIWQTASVINFVVFLNKGIYPTLLDRFLCLRHVYNKPQTLKKANFKFMNRELLWHGYAEFLFFIIPLISVDKLKSILRRIIGLRSPPSQIQGSLVASGNLSRSCPVCSRSPTQPYISECGHLFCYICIKSNFLSNPSFACPLCNIAIGQNITPYRPQ